jgi:hypothetical protein
MTPSNVAVVSTRLDMVQEAYDGTKAFVALFLPYLPAAQAARIRLAGALVDKALLAAHVATDMAERKVAISEAEAAIAQFKLVSGS